MSFWSGSRRLDYPIDHPDLLPICAAAEEHGLCVVHDSQSAGYPGHRDMWDNPFIRRTASHPWAAATPRPVLQLRRADRAPTASDAVL